MYRRIVSSTAFLLAAASSAVACSCILPDDKTCGSGLVGLYVDVASGPEYCDDVAFFDVKVKDVIKNDVEDLEIEIGDVLTVSSDLSTSCGFELSHSSRYLLYANPAGEGLDVVDLAEDEKEDDTEDDDTEEDDGEEDDTEDEDGDDGPGTVSATAKHGKATASVKTAAEGETKSATATSGSRRLLEDVPSVKVTDVVKDVPDEEEPSSPVTVKDGFFEFKEEEDDEDEEEEKEDEEKDEEEEEDEPEPVPTPPAPKAPKEKEPEPAEEPAPAPAPAAKKCHKTAVLHYYLCQGTIQNPTRKQLYWAQEACAV